MMVTAARSRSWRSRMPRARKFITPMRLCHLLQVGLVLYLLSATCVSVNKPWPSMQIKHRRATAVPETSTQPYVLKTEARKTLSPSPSSRLAVVVPVNGPLVRGNQPVEPVAHVEKLTETQPSLQRRKLKSPDRWPYNHLRPPTVLGFSLQGGVGNQIYNILEALYLARQVRAVMLLPAVLPRADIREDDDPAILNVRRGNSVWNLAQLAKGTKGRHVYPYMPSMCRGRFDVLYYFLRKNQAQPNLDTIPRVVRWAACALVRAAPGHRQPDCEGVFAHTTVLVRRQNLTAGGDSTFLRELDSLRRTPFPSKAPDEPLCVWVFGHSYDRASREGDEYLYSHMHFVSAHPRIVKMTKKWPLDSMVVVHVRYDEELCDTDSHDDARICVRAHKDGHRPDPVYWAPIKEYVRVICNQMKEEGIRSLYLAASPYVPEKTVKKLQREFAKHVRVAKSAQSVYEDESDINFLERELAIQSSMFIGDFGSTWSGTVYYKRRTMDKITHWTNVLLDVAINVGYYGRTERLEMPD